MSLSENQTKSQTVKVRLTQRTEIASYIGPDRMKQQQITSQNTS